MPALAHEVAVVALLSRRRPDCLPELLAADVARGWLLQADGGPRLREVLEETQDHGRWTEILPRYAQLQIDATQIVQDLRRAGAPDRGLAALPTAFAWLLARQQDLEPGAVAQLRALCRALTWELVAEATPAADRGEYHEAVADRLQLLAGRL